jgi:hypothetical protein
MCCYEDQKLWTATINNRHGHYGVCYIRLWERKLYQSLTFMWPCIVTNFLIIKPTTCTNFSNLFWNETLHVSHSYSVHHRELFTVHTAMVYVVQVCRQLSSSRIRMELVPSWSCSQVVYKPVWHVPLLSVEWITPDDGQSNCPKHAEFHSKINLRN